MWQHVQLSSQIHPRGRLYMLLGRQARKPSNKVTCLVSKPNSILCISIQVLCEGQRLSRQDRCKCNLCEPSTSSCTFLLIMWVFRLATGYSAFEVIFKTLPTATRKIPVTTASMAHVFVLSPYVYYLST